MTDEHLPIIGISACTAPADGYINFKVGEKYVTAAASAARCVPMLIPPLGDWYGTQMLLDRLDGLYLTGSPSNVEPHHYEGQPSREGVEHDPARDATTLPLIRMAIEMGVPLFAVCRGHQELNVAMGGTLHQHLQEVPGKEDHRMERDRPFDERYRARHAVTISAGGILERLHGSADRVMVNSLHEQAIDVPGPDLFIEAVSDDGVIEAVSVKSAKAFALSVQWHPEHKVALQWPLSQAMYRAFGDAARDRMKSRRVDQTTSETDDQTQRQVGQDEAFATR